MSEKFSCLGKNCPNHCCGSYSGISDKLKEFFPEEVNFTEIILLPDDVKRLKDAGKEEYIVEGKNGIYKIKTYEDGTCFALQDGRCAVYEQRPAICKAFPLYIDMFTGLCYSTECPVFTPDKLGDESIPLKSLIDIYKYWIERLEKKLKD